MLCHEKQVKATERGIDNRALCVMNESCGYAKMLETAMQRKMIARKLSLSGNERQWREGLEGM